VLASAIWVVRGGSPVSYLTGTTTRQDNVCPAAVHAADMSPSIPLNPVADESSNTFKVCATR